MYVNNLSQGSSHLRYDIPVVLGGNLGGRFRSGNFLDYTTAVQHTVENSGNKQVGVDYTRTLVTVLQGFGLSEAEYQQPGMPQGGFGSDQRSSKTHPKPNHRPPPRPASGHSHVAPSASQPVASRGAR